MPPLPYFFEFISSQTNVSTIDVEFFILSVSMRIAEFNKFTIFIEPFKCIIVSPQLPSIVPTSRKLAFAFIKLNVLMPPRDGQETIYITIDIFNRGLPIRSRCSQIKHFNYANYKAASR